MKKDICVLVVDDKVEMAEMISDALTEAGYCARFETSGARAHQLLLSSHFDALITDIRMPDMDGMALLSASISQDPKRPVLMMTAYAAIDSAIESIRRGAFHYLTKPFKLEELFIHLERALSQRSLLTEAEYLREQLRSHLSFRSVIAESQAMQHVVSILHRVADADAPILILGETGTGKSLLARSIHENSHRKKYPFITINCAAIPEALLESELFGHEKGAFTGASNARNGLFVAADHGTLLLDEIGDMPLSLQAKLLHVLESNAVRPVGSMNERKVDVRIIASTHRNLSAQAQAGLFRSDLLYRLDVVSVLVPPLRSRREDISPFVEHFFALAKQKHPRAQAKKIHPKAMALLLDYTWPGNVRQLAHVIQRAVLLSEKEEIEVAELQLNTTYEVAKSVFETQELLPMRELQRRYAIWAHHQCQQQKGTTAEKLGIDPKTLNKFLHHDNE